ncbi:IS1595 family transposase [Novosphingobium album (ex Liu et al. 2023)]|uniref:IS1595 family transposase n=1 Tax=Novosphingobium album (ex Liu et al. 2023) TaxID=3031130 RepID=A0ABT5WLR5_9SPHN|nr:IS1595 family transposase [Novosphingobium album (ex Liu et al. 2023)]MDE8650972.1 IS1595 family transposase [Novosphingobium album (ex Liu et al. 2023)]
MTSALSAPHFHSEEAAYAYVEARIWPEGAVCPHCGGVERISKMQGKSTRVGAYKCYQCRKPFTVKIGTIFEDSKVAMHIWLQAMYLIAGSKKGISSNQLHRTLGVTLKTAWFMSHRIREAMRSDDTSMFGGSGGVVEVDETFIGQLKGVEKRRAFHHKMKVLALVDRDSGKARTMVIENVKAETLMPIVLDNVAREARVMTDEHSGYRDAGKFFAGHGTTSHGKGEYVNLEDRSIHSNTVEGYFSIFKRGMKGVYQFCGEQHLHRYLAEFEFRYNNRVAHGCNDADRADALLSGIIGKRLTYQTASARA